MEYMKCRHALYYSTVLSNSYLDFLVRTRAWMGEKFSGRVKFCFGHATKLPFCSFSSPNLSGNHVVAFLWITSFIITLRLFSPTGHPWRISPGTTSPVATMVPHLPLRHNDWVLAPLCNRLLSIIGFFCSWVSGCADLSPACPFDDWVVFLPLCSLDVWVFSPVCSLDGCLLSPVCPFDGWIVFLPLRPFDGWFVSSCLSIRWLARLSFSLFFWWLGLFSTLFSWWLCLFSYLSIWWLGLFLSLLLGWPFMSGLWLNFTFSTLFSWWLCLFSCLSICWLGLFSSLSVMLLGWPFMSGLWLNFTFYLSKSFCEVSYMYIQSVKS